MRTTLGAAGVRLSRVRFHHIPTNECWTRDHGPAFVQRTRRGKVETAIVDWGFNAWGGKYPPWEADDARAHARGSGPRACRSSTPTSSWKAAPST